MSILNEEHLIVTTKAKSDALEVRFNSLMGYPKTGSDIGSGRHITPTPVTIKYAVGRKHPIETKWAFPVHAQEQSELTGAEQDKLTTLTSDWLPSAAQL